MCVGVASPKVQAGICCTTAQRHRADQLRRQGQANHRIDLGDQLGNRVKRNAPVQVDDQLVDAGGQARQALQRKAGDIRFKTGKAAVAVIRIGDQRKTEIHVAQRQPHRAGQQVALGVACPIDANEGADVAAANSDNLGPLYRRAGNVVVCPHLGNGDFLTALFHRHVATHVNKTKQVNAKKTGCAQAVAIGTVQRQGTGFTLAQRHRQRGGASAVIDNLVAARGLVDCHLEVAGRCGKAVDADKAEAAGRGFQRSPLPLPGGAVGHQRQRKFGIVQRKTDTVGFVVAVDADKRVDILATNRQQIDSNLFRDTIEVFCQGNRRA